MAKIAQASKDRVLSLQNQKLLASALNSEERQQFERQIKINELLLNKKGLTQEQLAAEMEALTALFAQQDATKKLLKDKEAQEKQEKKLADQQKKAAEDLNKIYEGIGSSIKDGVIGAIKGAIDGTKTLKEVAVNLLNDIASKLLDFAINMALFGVGSGFGTGGGLLGGLFKFGGGQAKGGPVSAGTSYIVGEKGPEMFTPSRSGTIIPNNAMGGANVTVNVDASGSSAEGDAEQSKRLGKAIGAAVQAELLKQQRPGGLLAR